MRALPHHTRPIVAVLAAALLPILVFPEVVLQGQSFYFEDLSWFHLPLRMLIADLWKSGTWPLWNPYSYNGFPLLAEFQVGALSPQNWVFLQHSFCSVCSATSFFSYGNAQTLRGLIFGAFTKQRC